VWVALLEVFLLKVRFSRMVWLGLAICMIGGSLIFIISALQGAELSGSNIVLGNGLALLGAMFGGVYIIMGRQMRQKVSLVPYLWLMFGVGGLLALAFNLARNIPILGYSPEAEWWLLMVTVFPTLLGHTFFNAALGYLSATLVTLSGQVVTLTATISAFFIFGEIPTVHSLVAGCIIVVGVLIAAAGQRRKPKAAAVPTG
jgi:drug/metabolite transporter (DMT)-like permease